MEHSLPQLQTPWRTATVVACVVAALEMVVVVVLGAALLADPVSRHVTKAAEQEVLRPVVAKPKPTKGAPTLARGATSVLVLNGNGRAGAAATTAEHVRGIGYTVGGVGNAPRTDVTRSLVMYRPGHEAEGKRLARDLRIKSVGPLDGIKPGELLGAHVAVVVGQ